MNSKTSTAAWDTLNTVEQSRQITCRCHSHIGLRPSNHDQIRKSTGLTFVEWSKL